MIWKKRGQVGNNAPLCPTLEFVAFPPRKKEARPEGCNDTDARVLVFFECFIALHLSYSLWDHNVLLKKSILTWKL